MASDLRVGKSPRRAILPSDFQNNTTRVGKWGNCCARICSFIGRCFSFHNCHPTLIWQGFPPTASSVSSSAITHMSYRSQSPFESGSDQRSIDSKEQINTVASEALEHMTQSFSCQSLSDTQRLEGRTSDLIKEEVSENYHKAHGSLSASVSFDSLTGNAGLEGLASVQNE